MTASERLRALAVHTEDVGWSLEVQQGWLIDVGNALPLIADAIEAAEAIVPTESHEIVGPYEYVRGDELYAARVALTALTEHLEGGDE